MKNKVVLITGASRGIGRAIAHEFAKHAAYIIGTATTRAAADTMTSDFSKAQINGIGLPLNVTDQHSIKQFSEALSRYESPSILINNAGIAKDNLLIRMQYEQWENVINTNLNGLYHLSKLCIRPMLKARYGRIINITSVVGFSGNLGQTNYAAAKAGIVGFTRSLAREVGARGITVNAVAPGFIETDMTDKLDNGIKQHILQQISLGRLGEPREVATAVRFLASDDACYITGQTIHVNGGMYMA